MPHLLDRVADHAKSYLENLDDLPVAARVDGAALRTRLYRDLQDRGVAAEQVIEELIADAQDGLNTSAGGRFFGWVIGGSLPSALAADWLTSTWDQNAHTYATSPAVAVIEEIAGSWLKDLLGLPASASFALVTGCQMAHATCLAAARHHVLARAGWDVETQGLYGAPPVQVITSDLMHGTVSRATRLLGMGTAHITQLKSDEDGHLPAAALEAALRERAGTPAILVLQAGDVNTGAFDDFNALVPLARKHGAWIHIDGAFGLWAAASPRYRALLDGASHADSWATDGHKWLNVPYDCGYAFVSENGALLGAMAQRSSYITYSGEIRDPVDYNPEFSRRARALPTYAAIRELGREGVASMIERCCDHARALVGGISSLPGAKLVHAGEINQGLVSFLDPNPGAAPSDHDRRTDEVIARICASGEALFSGTTWKGRRAMRISVSNWRTSREDVARAIRAVAAALG